MKAKSNSDNAVREFDPTRLSRLGKILYKLLGILVIIVSLVFGVKAFFTWIKVDNYNSGREMKQVSEICKEDPKDVGCVGRTYWIVLGDFNKNENELNHTIILAVALPLLFFGGTWLYKYLFPVKNE